MESYETFISDLKSSFEELWTVAEDKLWWEGFTLAGKGFAPMVRDYFRGAGETEEAKREETWDKIEKFAKDCCFDCSDLKGRMDKIEEPESIFKVIDAVREVDEGLDSWKEETSAAAATFKDYYVRDNHDRRDDQLKLLRWAHAFLDGSLFVVETNREIIKEAIKKTTESLEKYDPVEIWLFGTVEGVIAAVGCAFGPITSVAMVAADYIWTEDLKPASENGGMNVVETFDHLRTGVDKLHENANDMFEGLRTVVKEQTEQMIESEEFFVCSRPSQTMLDDSKKPEPNY